MINMDDIKMLETINSCVDCKNCMEVCDTFLVTNDVLKSPNERLKIAKKVFKVPARIGYPKGLDGLIDEISGPAFSTIQALKRSLKR